MQGFSRLLAIPGEDEAQAGRNALEVLRIQPTAQLAPVLERALERGHPLAHSLMEWVYSQTPADGFRSQLVASMVAGIACVEPTTPPMLEEWGLAFWFEDDRLVFRGAEGTLALHGASRVQDLVDLVQLLDRDDVSRAPRQIEWAPVDARIQGALRIGETTHHVRIEPSADETYFDVDGVRGRVRCATAMEGLLHVAHFCREAQAEQRLLLLLPVLPAPAEVAPATVDGLFTRLLDLLGERSGIVFEGQDWDGARPVYYAIRLLRVLHARLLERGLVTVNTPSKPEQPDLSDPVHAALDAWFALRERDGEATLDVPEETTPFERFKLERLLSTSVLVGATRTVEPFGRFATGRPVSHLGQRGAMDDLDALVETAAPDDWPRMASVLSPSQLARLRQRTVEDTWQLAQLHAVPALIAHAAGEPVSAELIERLIAYGGERMPVQHTLWIAQLVVRAHPEPHGGLLALAERALHQTDSFSTNSHYELGLLGRIDAIGCALLELHTGQAWHSPNR
jgi:hypothetical protein